MQRRAIWASLAVLLLGVMVAAQAQSVQEDYLDVYSVQVKPEKRADFDAMVKKMVAANRDNSGDNWLTMETVYGPGDRVIMISTRHSYAEAEKGATAFDQAIQKAYGKASDKMFQEYSQCLVNQRSELRRRRWDLSSNAPTDPAGYAKMIADARWLPTTAVHVRPGHVAEYEALLKEVKAAREKASPPQTVLVSQAVAGQEGNVFYITMLQSSLAGFDGQPSMPQLLGNEVWEHYQKTNAEVVSGTETAINRFLPEISNAPKEIVALAPDYWSPKSTAAVHAKADTPKAPVVNAKTTTKIEEKK
ncbi:MAG TPA: hypothetical protein VNY29_02155 [Terriglobales bacterium]|jgi:hypothetical protein|nr:hypothetical protein [Terriglobales bacterium]